MLATVFTLALAATSALATPAPAPACKTIAELVEETPELSTLLTAVTKANAAVLSTLADADQELTVFAPTNKAFARIPADTLSGLIADQAALTNVLLYHVADEVLYAADLSNGDEIETLEGDDVTVRITKRGRVFINDARVVIADIKACNGVGMCGILRVHGFVWRSKFAGACRASVHVRRAYARPRRALEI